MVGPGSSVSSPDLDRWKDKDFCENSSLIIKGNRGFNENAETTEYEELIAKYSTIEDNVSYTLEENPIFVNPTLGDYRIREGADFPDIEFEKIGRY